MTIMPKLPTIETNLTDKERELVRGILATKGKNKGRLRASKPKVNRIKTGKLDRYGREEITSDETGMTAYVWRMVAFYCSPHRQHSCIPVLCEFDLPKCKNRKHKQALIKRLDQIVDKIIDPLPLEQKPGLGAWSKSYGLF